jgi:hypothetical protein
LGLGELTRHAVSFGCWESGGVHVDDSAGCEVVVFLGGEIEVPVFGVVWEESEAVELAVCCDEFGDEVWVFCYVDGKDVLGEGKGQTRYREGSCEHVVLFARIGFVRCRVRTFQAAGKGVRYVVMAHCVVWYNV